ncbi:MAG TPA: hypothetical protein VMF91_12610 [Bryobacteraceae bacterium]|nr:hypothetical protein [Bryobacteraceae bacterium]
MNDLFRFLIMRKPDANQPDAALPLATDTALNGQLQQARSSSQPRDAMQQLATQFLQSSQAVQSASSLKLGAGLPQFIAGLDEATTADQQNALVQASFGASAYELAKSPDLTCDLQRISDTLLALQLAPATPPGVTVADLANLFRGLQLVEQLGSGTAPTTTNNTPVLQRPLLLPANIFPLSTTREQQQPPPPPDPAAGQAQDALVKRATDLTNALQALTDASAVQLASTAEIAAPVSAVHVSAVTTQQANQRIVSKTPSVGETATMPFVLTQLPASARETISSISEPVANMPLGPLTNTLRLELTKVVSQIDPSRYKLLFPSLQPTAEPAEHDDATDPPPAVLSGPPSSHGTVAPAGIADLLVVRQHVLRYEPGEVAYVENVAAGEDFQRVTKRLQATQTTVTVTQTTSSSNERDTQATSRFDLNRQSNSVLQSDYARVPGAPNSETYGALVQSGGSKSDATSTATDFGQDVTSRAASQITQQFQSQTVTQTSNSFKEDITHHFDNSSATGDHVVVYQWLDKICQAQVFTYGKRLLYDINVPEPGAFLLRALANQQPDVLTLQKPLPFTLRPDQLDATNYFYYAAGYGATGVQPPPDLYQTVSMPWDIPPTAGDEPVINTTRSTTITIPEGYSATKAFVGVSYIFFTDLGSPSFFVNVGRRALHLGGAGDKNPQSTALDGEIGTLPLLLLVDGSVFDCTVAIEILCTRTDTAFTNWQLRTYDTILQASNDRISEYQTTWATLRAALQMLTFGQSADRKLQLQRMELQKAALAVLTNQQFDTLGDIEHSAQGYPQPFLPNVEPVGRYVRFLEQSFEWDQIMYLYYPYFWGRKPYWIDRVLLEDSDDTFGDFLRAGSARVIVPVRPGFEGVVGNFMATGAVPTTQELGQLTSSEYLPYLTELQGSTDGPDTAQPYGPPWEIRLPTTLTVVRKDATLPRWKQQTDTTGVVTWVSDGSDAIG